MTRYFTLMAAAVAALLPGASLAAAGAATVTVSGTWGTAEEVPGIAVLDHGGSSDLLAVACGSAGNCSAGGHYNITSGQEQAFVVNQANGTWGTAHQVPGLAALNTGRFAGIETLSCGAAGNCAAGGFYHQHSSSGPFQAFVVNEKRGTWGTAKEVPGLAALNTGGGAMVLSVSCASAGNCSAGGNYATSSGSSPAFVVSETNGTWSTAQEVPGLAALSPGQRATIFSMSCASPGNCAAGGVYRDSVNREQAFVVSQVNGTWGTAEQVPGTAALNPRGRALVSSVSCPAPGKCGAGGLAGGHAYVVNETNGTWGTAEEVPGIAALNNGLPAEVDSVSCAAAGSCSAGGSYIHGAGKIELFVATETNGTWGTAQEVPGTAALNQGGNAELNSVSCGAAGNCGAGGFYQDGAGRLQAFVASQVNGTWHTAQRVPGIAALNPGGNSLLSSMSCAAAGNCSAGGNFAVNTAHQQAFVVSETT